MKPTFPGILGREFARVDKTARALRPGSVPGMLVSRTSRGVLMKPLARPARLALPELVMVVKELRNALLCVRGRDLGNNQGIGVPALGARPLDRAAFLVAKPPALRQDWNVGGPMSAFEYLPDTDARRAYCRRKRSYLSLGTPAGVVHNFTTNTEPAPGMNWVPATRDFSSARSITEEIDPPYLRGTLPFHSGSALYSSWCYLYVQKLPPASKALGPESVLVEGEESELREIAFTDPPFSDVYTVAIEPPVATFEGVFGTAAPVRYVDCNLDARRWRDLNLNQLNIENLNDQGFYRTDKQPPA